MVYRNFVPAARYRETKLFLLVHSNIYIITPSFLYYKFEVSFGLLDKLSFNFDVSQSASKYKTFLALGINSKNADYELKVG